MNSAFLLCENWFSLLSSKLLQKVFGINVFPVSFIKLRNGQKFVVKKNKLDVDLFTLTEVIYDKVYNPPFFDIQPNDIVLDIGANKGYFSLYAARTVNAQVYCFEPVPNLFDIIKENIQINNTTNIFPQNVAVSNKSGKTDFFLAEKDNVAHSLFNALPSMKKIEVETVTLEDFCKKHALKKINFLKMDCEGSEYDILLGATKEFLSSIEKISMEYHDGSNEHKHQELVDFLEKNNFLVTTREEYLYALNLTK